MPSPDITACICTLDRQDGMEATFLSLVAQQVDSSRVELLIVDNGSNLHDPIQACAALVEIAQNRGFKANFVVEKKLGLSNARNRAISESNADWVAFIDDDEIASIGFLDSLLRALDTENHDVKLGCLGGPLRLSWPGSEPPDWYSDALAGYYTGLDFGPNPHDLDPRRELLFGGNLVVHKHSVEELGGFNISLDRQGHSSLMGLGDTLIQFVIADSGKRIRYVPDALIDHIVLPERVSVDWILARAYGQGRSDVKYRHILYRHGRFRQFVSAFRDWYRRHKSMGISTNSNRSNTLRKDQLILLARVHRSRFFGFLRAVLFEKI